MTAVYLYIYVQYIHYMHALYITYSNLKKANSNSRLMPPSSYCHKDGCNSYRKQALAAYTRYPGTQSTAHAGEQVGTVFLLRHFTPAKRSHGVRTLVFLLPGEAPGDPWIRNHTWATSTCRTTGILSSTHIKIFNSQQLEYLCIINASARDNCIICIKILLSKGFKIDILELGK